MTFSHRSPAGTSAFIIVFLIQAGNPHWAPNRVALQEHLEGEHHPGFGSVHFVLSGQTCSAIRLVDVILLPGKQLRGLTRSRPRPQYIENPVAILGRAAETGPDSRSTNLRDCHLSAVILAQSAACPEPQPCQEAGLVRQIPTISHELQAAHHFSCFGRFKSRICFPARTTRSSVSWTTEAFTSSLWM